MPESSGEWAGALFGKPISSAVHAVNYEEARVRIEAAVVGYLDVSDVLRDDLEVLLATTGNQDGKSRRNVVRAGGVLVEGYLYQLALLARVGVESESESDSQLSASQRRAILDDRAGLEDRFKAVTRFMHNLCEIETPDFGGAGWREARHFIVVRNAVTHPKSVDDLDMDSDERFEAAMRGLFFLIETLIGMVDGLRRWADDRAGADLTGPNE